MVEGENVVFSLPGSVAPWKKDAALDTTTQVCVVGGGKTQNQTKQTKQK